MMAVWLQELRSCRAAHDAGMRIGFFSRLADSESSVMMCGSTAVASAMVSGANPNRLVHMRRSLGIEGSTRYSTFNWRSRVCRA